MCTEIFQIYHWFLGLYFFYKRMQVVSFYIVYIYHSHTICNDVTRLHSGKLLNSCKLAIPKTYHLKKQAHKDRQIDQEKIITHFIIVSYYKAHFNEGSVKSRHYRLLVRRSGMSANKTTLHPSHNV